MADVYMESRSAASRPCNLSNRGTARDKLLDKGGGNEHLVGAFHVAHVAPMWHPWVVSHAALVHAACVTHPCEVAMLFQTISLAR